MYIANPKTSIATTALDCHGTADVTFAFHAASALFNHPAEIILLLDRSAGITPEELTAVKTAAKQFIGDVARATLTADPGELGSQTSLGIASFSDTATKDVALEHNVDTLTAAVDGLQAAGGPANYKAGFEAAHQMFLKTKGHRYIVVLFSHSAEAALSDADPVVEQMKADGVEIFCMGLLKDPAKLRLWASDTPENHVSWTNAPGELNQVFREIAAEVVLAGVLDGVLELTVEPDFTITGYDAPSDGTAALTGDRTLTWTMAEAAIAQQPITPTLTVQVQHTGTGSGTKEVIQSAVYRDRYANTLTFPGAQAAVTCAETGTDLYPEPCPEPVEFTVEGCRDAAHVALGAVALQGLGRIVQVDATLKAICPGKQVAASIILMEVAPDGTELPRGVKHILVPAQTGDACRDVTLNCVQFSLPEALDAGGKAGSICDPRQFAARVIANYVDTDFACCDVDTTMQ